MWAIKAHANCSQFDVNHSCLLVTKTMCVTRPFQKVGNEWPVYVHARVQTSVEDAHFFHGKSLAATTLFLNSQRTFCCQFRVFLGHTNCEGFCGSHFCACMFAGSCRVLMSISLINIDKKLACNDTEALFVSTYSAASNTIQSLSNLARSHLSPTESRLAKPAHHTT